MISILVLDREYRYIEDGGWRRTTWLQELRSEAAVEGGEAPPANWWSDSDSLITTDQVSDLAN